MLQKTRMIWKRRIQSRIFDFAGIRDFLDEQELHALEDHMGFRGQLPEHRRFQIEELKRLGLTPSSSVLEIGCGPLTAGIPVIQYLEANRYVGVDLRADVLDLAWQQIGRLQLAAKNPRILRSEDFGSDILGEQKFDYLWAFSVLFHLSDELLDRLFAMASKRLGRMLVANIQTTEQDSTWLQFPFLNRSVEAYAEVAARHGLDTKNLGTLQERGFGLAGAERRNILLQFTAKG